VVRFAEMEPERESDHVQTQNWRLEVPAQVPTCSKERRPSEMKEQFRHSGIGLANRRYGPGVR